KATALRIIAENASVACPWVAVARLCLSGPILVPWVALLAWTAAAYLFARWQFQSNLRYDFQAAEATDLSAQQGEDSWISKLLRLPSALIPDPVGALMEKELLALSRTPRFRLVFIMGFTFGLVVWIPLIFGKGHDIRSGVVGNFLTLLCLYALALLGQVTYWNSFGFDRSAVQAYFAWPAPLSRALVGKNLAAAVVVLLEITAVTMACLLLRITPGPERILEAFLMTPIIAIYLFSAGNICSVYMPRPLATERSAQGRSAGRSQAFMLVMYPLALAPALLAYGARYAFRSQLAFYLMLVFDAALGAVVYWVALDSAAKAAEQRREQMI